MCSTIPTILAVFNVRTILALAQSLDLHAVLKVLRACGKSQLFTFACMAASTGFQGYLFGRPAPFGVLGRVAVLTYEERGMTLQSGAALSMVMARAGPLAWHALAAQLGGGAAVCWGPGWWCWGRSGCTKRSAPTNASWQVVLRMAQELMPHTTASQCHARCQRATKPCSGPWPWAIAAPTSPGAVTPCMPSAPASGRG